MRLRFLPLLLVLHAGLVAADESQTVSPRHALGTLHGFPSMSDTNGRVIADGELTQERVGDRLLVKIRWVFSDGRAAEERDEFKVDKVLTQRRFSWVETRQGDELRRFEVDFSSGTGLAVLHDEKGETNREESKLDLPAGRCFTGYGTALAVTELSPAAGEEARITFVAFTPKPRTVTLKVSRDKQDRLSVAGRPLDTDRYTLHPEIPFPANVFVSAPDAHLWFTHTRPIALVRAEQNLIVKDDPRVVIDVTPRGPARTSKSDARSAGGPALD
jgi:hypothetical protein